MSSLKSLSPVNLTRIRIHSLLDTPEEHIVISLGTIEVNIIDTHLCICYKCCGLVIIP